MAERASTRSMTSLYPAATRSTVPTTPSRVTTGMPALTWALPTLRRSRITRK